MPHTKEDHIEDLKRNTSSGEDNDGYSISSGSSHESADSERHDARSSFAITNEVDNEDGIDRVLLRMVFDMSKT